MPGFRPTELASEALELLRRIRSRASPRVRGGTQFSARRCGPVRFNSACEMLGRDVHVARAGGRDVPTRYERGRAHVPCWTGGYLRHVRAQKRTGPLTLADLRGFRQREPRIEVCPRPVSVSGATRSCELHAPIPTQGRRWRHWARRSASRQDSSRTVRGTRRRIEASAGVQGRELRPAAPQPGPLALTNVGAGTGPPLTRLGRRTGRAGRAGTAPTPPRSGSVRPSGRRSRGPGRGRSPTGRPCRRTTRSPRRGCRR